MNEPLNILLTYWFNGVFVLLAVLFNSGMDSLRHSFDTSFARNWDKQFWDPSISSQNKYIDYPFLERTKIWFIVIPAAFTDGWHQLKMWMLGFMMIAMSLNATETLLTDLYLFLFYAVIWNGLFNPIYYKLRKW